MSQYSTMQLRITLPYHSLLEAVTTRIVAEGTHGAFCLLPNHIDCLVILVPGILVYESEAGTDHYLAVGQGVLVKQATLVSVSALNAIPGEDLDQLQQAVETQFRQLDEQEKLMQSALTRLEVGLTRHFTTLVEGG
jgi:F-type H+-transporting ATPase subunit epsilon